MAGEQEIAIDPNAHSWGAWTVIRNAAVGVEGSEQRVCAHDGTHVETRVIAALLQPQNGGNANGATTGGNAASGATGGNGAAGGATGGVEAAVTDGTGNVAGTQGAGEAIEGDETLLAAPDETTIADDANPLRPATRACSRRTSTGRPWRSRSGRSCSSTAWPSPTC